MQSSIKKPVFTFIMVVTSFILLAGCIVHVGSSKANASFDDDYSAVNKSLTISQGKHIDDASSVNGNLTLEDNVTADEVSSVNGAITIGDNVKLDELSSVNGKLTTGANLYVKDDVSTVNGSILIRKNSRVMGDVTSVNGAITLQGVMIEGDIETVNASITLTDNTHVKGDVIYFERNSNTNNRQGRKNPVLRIDESVKIDGNIILGREVDVELSDQTLQEKIIRKY